MFEILLEFLYFIYVFFRYGFNSDGHDIVYDRIKQLNDNAEIQYTIGVNLGKNKTTEDALPDYIEGIKKFAQISNYLVINISRYVTLFVFFELI